MQEAEVVKADEFKYLESTIKGKRQEQVHKRGKKESAGRVEVETSASSETCSDVWFGDSSTKKKGTVGRVRADFHWQWQEWTRND